MADDDDEYEDARDGNRLLEFMFGNIDGASDLDIDYLDEVSALIFYRFIYIPGGAQCQMGPDECDEVEPISYF